MKNNRFVMCAFAGVTVLIASLMARPAFAQEERSKAATKGRMYFAWRIVCAETDALKQPQ
jgi:invasion protein IalB